MSGIRVVFAASEAAPFAKTGGLADVAGALPRALAERDENVTVMLPLYRAVRRSGVELRPLEPAEIAVPLGPWSIRVGLEGTPPEAGPVRVVFLRYDPYFDREEMYGRGEEDYPDNAHRFSLFSHGVMVAAEALGLAPQIYHVHDWQTSLVCAYLRGLTRDDRAPRSVLTIHNIGYQGLFWKWDLPWTGLGWGLFNPDGVEFYDRVNFLKAGIVFADAVTTVSPTYAREIQASPELGAGLDGVLRARSSDVSGIVNGIDRSVWNPQTDRHLPANYSAADLGGKAACKAALQGQLGLPVAARAPLVGSVGRLAEQKGMGLFLDSADEILKSEPDVQFAILGSGGADLERALRRLASRHPEHVKVVVGFDEALAHRIEAGCDMFLMPSLYEPCGLNQMYSMAYGTLPIVRRTGGLADTVIDASDDGSEGTGFVFDEFAAVAFRRALGRAVACYRNPPAWGRLVARAMSRDWSWDRSAGEYVELYRRVLTRFGAAEGGQWPGR